ncbi:MAG: hypothetical protein HFI39_11690 [Lachnospiraceae bacterium]|nr:hypothetical protein [Lachnospiraceae bacterium]
MDYQSLIPVVGTVLSIRRQSSDCCSQLIALRTENGPVNFFLSSQTLVLGSVRIRPGMRIAACYDASLPVPLIFPPQYQAQLIAALRPDEQAYIGYFNSDLTSMNQDLSLNIARSTTILTSNGQGFDCTPANHVLLVCYTATTRSLPPQTTPRKIFVLC